MTNGAESVSAGESLLLLALFALPLLGLAGLAYKVYLRKRPPRTPAGDFLLVDVGDQPRSIWVSALVAGFVALCLAVKGVQALLALQLVYGGELLAFALGAVVVGLLVAVNGTAESAIAGAGEVRVPAWPLKGGQRTTLRYRRPLVVKEGIGAAEAFLVLRENTANVGHAELQRIPLGDGGSRVEGDDLVAAWDLELPDPTNGRGGLGRRWHHTRWQLEVVVPVAGEQPTAIDSHIPLPIQP